MYNLNLSKDDQPFNLGSILIFASCCYNSLGYYGISISGLTAGKNNSTRQIALTKRILLRNVTLVLRLHTLMQKYSCDGTHFAIAHDLHYLDIIGVNNTLWFTCCRYLCYCHVVNQLHVKPKSILKKNVIFLCSIHQQKKQAKAFDGENPILQSDNLSYNGSNVPYF